MSHRLTLLYEIKSILKLIYFLIGWPCYMKKIDITPKYRFHKKKLRWLVSRVSLIRNLVFLYFNFFVQSTIFQRMKWMLTILNLITFNFKFQQMKCSYCPSSGLNFPLHNFCTSASNKLFVKWDYFVDIYYCVYIR